ncbi:MobH family relaxase [Pseudomonas lopnurensis]|uniref:MobH family relaxase n=1 Tax=Pseudomonas lopnurensis TaxID=1477517 RepID=UPI0028A97A9C|nr:MobH family relaxase [Pseudomonas lopnurensis]
MLKLIKFFSHRAAAAPAEQKDICPDGYTVPEPASTLLDTPLRQRLLEIIWQRTSMSKQHFDQLYMDPIRRYAALVQLLPASEMHHHAYPGGLLDHGLEIIAYALKLRQSHLLPPGAAPEDQSAQAEAWTAGVAYGALLHDIGKIAVDQQVELASGKTWRPWHGPIAEPYRMRFVRGRDYHQHPAAGSLLVPQILSPAVLDWIAGIPLLFGQLAFVLSGHYDQAGALGEIIIKADKASVAKALGGNPAKAMAVATAPQDSLQGRLLRGLRQMIRESGADAPFRLNQPGASGWLTDDALWLVSKPVSDRLRALLMNQGMEGVPTRNSRLFDELQAHGIIQATPGKTPKAIWDCTIQDPSGWKQTLTMLRVSPALIWEAGEDRPASFAGEVVVETGAAGADAADDPNAATKTATQGSASAPELVAPTAPQPLAPISMDFEIPFDDHDEELSSIYLSALPSKGDEPDELELLMQGGTKTPSAAPGPSASETESRTSDDATNDVIEASSPACAQTNTANAGTWEGEELGQRFIAWLRDGLNTRRIVINDAKAKVHTVAGTAFIVTPGVFQRFVMEHPSRINAGDGHKESELWKEVQKQFQKLRLHKKTDNGLNIWKCSVIGQQKARSHLQGYLLNNPAILFDSVPPDNPFLRLEQGE